VPAEAWAAGKKLGIVKIGKTFNAKNGKIEKRREDKGGIENSE